MRLSRIEIENFKGVSTRQAIDLRPITLLFGPNSAGKSTILQALHYVREILERYNADPDQTIAGGLIDLGGFKALVHNHELDLPMKLKLIVDVSDDQGSDWLPLNSGVSLQDAVFETLPVRYLVGENTDLREYAVVKEIGVELEVRWSELQEHPYVSVLSTEIDGQPVARIQSPPQSGRGMLTSFNFAHPLLAKISDPNELKQDPDADETRFGAYDPFVSPMGGEIWELSREMASVEAVFSGSDFRIAVATKSGALPDLTRPLGADLRDPDVSKYELEHTSRRVQALATLLDEVMLGPARIVRDCLSAMTYIGPLREIPARSFRPQVSPDESRWAKGLAAWDMLHKDVSGQLISDVNSWLAGDERLGTDYRVEKVSFKEIPFPSRLAAMFDRGLTEDDLGELQELYEYLEMRSEIGLRDFKKGILVAPSDVGVGISQMIPVVVGCLDDRPGLVAIEQPELHIHPAVQVGLGDLFITCTSNDGGVRRSPKSLLVETHSEHIMLRLLRRIRETTQRELPPGILPLSHEDLSVVYVETAESGVEFRSLRIDQDGEFKDRWPRGFFEERAEELF